MNNAAIDEDLKKARVVLLSGFLGAGKTTLLKHLLSWESDLTGTVVIVNEFGEVGIDGSLLQDVGTDVVELTSGCICCTLSTGLKQSLERIWEQYRPRRILIESSGVADPTSIVSVLSMPGLKHCMHLQGVITVLDADFWSAREVFGRLFYNQLELANLILLNKVDLLEDEQVSLFLREIHDTVPDCRVVPTIHCGVAPDMLWETHAPGSMGLKPIEFFQGAATRRSVDADGYVTFIFTDSRPLDKECFNRFVANLPFEVFRMKGPVRFPDRTVMVNFVGGRCDITTWEESSDTQLAFIGWQVDKEETLAQLNACVSR